jgi:hypothetical protein
LEIAPGKEADLKLLAKSRVGLAKGTRCLADLGYLGLLKWFCLADLPYRKPPNRKGVIRELSAEQKDHNARQRRERVGIEHMIGRLKVFALLSHRYRNRRKRFGLRVNLIAALVNRDRYYARLYAQTHL